MRRNRPGLWGRGGTIAAALLAAFLLASMPFRPAWAHDVPDEILVTAFAKPEAERLHVLVRVPLIMLTSINLPKWGPGYLALDQVDEVSDRMLSAVARQVAFYEEGERLQYGNTRYRISQPSERNFETYEGALAHVSSQRLAEDAQVFWNQGYLDTYFEYPITSEQSTFTLDFAAGTGMSGRLKLAMLYIPPDRTGVAYTIHGNTQGLALNPQWHHAVKQFVKQGFDHILGGLDHVLFLLCLIVPFRLRSFKTLVAVITSFTLAHSVTLIASALGYVPTGNWFMPLVEFLIAVSILYMALENVLAVWWKTSGDAILRRRWIVTGAFGLVHGFGFSFLLREQLQFAGPYVVTSLLAFNVGVELGQLLVLALLLPAVAIAFRTPRSHVACIVVISVLVGHTAWHWAGERAHDLRYVQWPALADVPLSLPLLALLLCMGAGAWWGLTRFSRRAHG